MVIRSFVWAMGLAVAVASCDPPFQGTGGATGALGSSQDGGPRGSATANIVPVTLEPPGSLTAAPSVFRLHVSGRPSFSIPSVGLVKGGLTSRELHEFTRQAVSATLAKRLVPTQTWTDRVGGLVVAPTHSLEAGQTYTLAVGDVPQATSIQIAETATPPLPRVWPPLGEEATASFGVWCGDADLPPFSVGAELSPGGPHGFLKRGAFSGSFDRACVRFETKTEPENDAVPVEAGVVDGWLPPPTVAIDAGPPSGVVLDPRPFRVSHAITPLVPVPCADNEVEFGPACAAVEDDRILIKPPTAPLLWVIAAQNGITVRASSGDPWVLLGLTPSTEASLDVALLDGAGALHRGAVVVTTLPAEAHVVINEVLAHPRGQKPGATWVEVVNDGTVPADLNGYVLRVGVADTPIPQGILEPGTFALLVTPGFSANDGVDPSVAPDALLLQVDRFGKRGLSNSGNELSLVDPSGVVVSQFPAVPEPKLGQSVARRVPSAPDGDPTSFALASPSPGARNGS